MSAALPLARSRRVHHVKCPDHVKPPTAPPDEPMKCRLDFDIDPMIGQMTALGLSLMRDRIGSSLYIHMTSTHTCMTSLVWWP